MKIAILVVLLAAAATAAVISNEVPDVVRVPDVADVGEMPVVILTDLIELIDVSELTDEVEELQTATGTLRNLNIGSIGPNDVLVFSRDYKAEGIAGQSQRNDIRLGLSPKITAIRVREVGVSQGATASVIRGGIGNSSVTIRLQSRRGRGYHFRLQLYVSSGGKAINSDIFG